MFAICLGDTSFLSFELPAKSFKFNLSAKGQATSQIFLSTFPKAWLRPSPICFFLDQQKEAASRFDATCKNGTGSRQYVLRVRNTWRTPLTFHLLLYPPPGDPMEAPRTTLMVAFAMASWGLPCSEGNLPLPPTPGCAEAQRTVAAHGAARKGRGAPRNRERGREAGPVPAADSRLSAIAWGDFAPNLPHPKPPSLERKPINRCRACDFFLRNSLTLSGWGSSSRR